MQLPIQYLMRSADYEGFHYLISVCCYLLSLEVGGETRRRVDFGESYCS
jgi:hypothetical protein